MLTSCAAATSRPTVSPTMPAAPRTSPVKPPMLHLAQDDDAAERHEQETTATGSGRNRPCPGECCGGGDDDDDDWPTGTGPPRKALARPSSLSGRREGDPTTAAMVVRETHHRAATRSGAGRKRGEDERTGRGA